MVDVLNIFAFCPTTKIEGVNLDSLAKVNQSASDQVKFDCVIVSIKCFQRVQCSIKREEKLIKRLESGHMSLHIQSEIMK